MTACRSRRWGVVLLAGMTVTVVSCTMQRVGLPSSLEHAGMPFDALQQTLPSALPASDIVSVESEAKCTFAPRTDGVWLFQPGPNPGQDLLTLKLKAKTGGQFLCLDFPVDPSLAAQGPGLAGNGNSIIGEIEIECGGPVTATVHSAVSQSNGGRDPVTVFDGVRKQGDPGWDGEGSGWELGGGKPARLIVQLDRCLPPGADVTVRLIAKSKWGGHVPGAVSAAIVGGTMATEALTETGKYRVQFAAWRKTVSQEIKALMDRPDAVDAVMNDRDAQAVLARAEFMRVFGDDGVWQVAQRKGGYRMLNAVLADMGWMEDMLSLEGQLTPQTLDNLRVIVAYAKRQEWQDPVAKRLATVRAHAFGKGNRFSMVQNFDFIDQARLAGLLHNGFDFLPVRLMQKACGGGTKADYEYMINALQMRTGEYLGACWAVPYRDPSPFGYSIQGWGYHQPWSHAYPHMRILRDIGGVCGSLSTYGSVAASHHGVPAFNVGQPAHCAYIVELNQRWPIGNDVSGGWSTGWGMGYGVSYVTASELYSLPYYDPAYPSVCRLRWLANQQKAAGMPLTTWGATYQRSLDLIPLDFTGWMGLFDLVEADAKVAVAAGKSAETVSFSPEKWIEFGQKGAGVFKRHQEAAWAIAMRCFKNGEKAVTTPAQRMDLLLKINQTVSQKAEPTLYGNPGFPGFLNQQADWLGDPSASVTLFGKLLALHYSEDPKYNWIFQTVMGWGNGRFAGDPKQAVNYAATLGSFFEALGAKADKVQIANAVSSGIHAASQTGDMASYQAWVGMGRKLLPPVTPGDVFLTPAQVAARPKFEPFPGSLLSASGMLHVNSPCGYNKPLSYSQVLDGGELGYFDTNNDQKPWATVTFDGPHELTGIVLVNRYEFAPEQPWDVPMVVSVFLDGRPWQEVATVSTTQTVYRIDLQGKGISAKRVRIERQPGPDKDKPNTGRLHMRNFMIYGK